jgi:hypothetical protein
VIFSGPFGTDPYQYLTQDSRRGLISSFPAGLICKWRETLHGNIAPPGNAVLAGKDAGNGLGVGQMLLGENARG